MILRLNPFRIIGYAFGVLAIGFGGFMLLGILLPGGWQAERSTEIAAPPQSVHSALIEAARWSEWTPGLESEVELFGPTEGVGSGRRWDDPGYGRGEFTITSADAPSEVRYDVMIEDGAIRILGQITLTPSGSGTRVVWKETGDFGWNPLLGYMAGRMEELQGEQLEIALAALKEGVE